MEPGLLVAVAAAIILFGAVSQRAERSIVTPPIWFVCVGFAICGHGLGWVDLSAGNTVIHGLAELTLVIVLFSDASRPSSAARWSPCVSARR